jgi:hypothetical protein
MKTNLSFRKWFALGLLVLAVLTVLVAQLQAEEEKPTGDFTTAVLNHTTNRGHERL